MKKTKLSKTFDFIKSLLYPTKCVNCKARIMPDVYLPLCPECLKEWENEKNELCPTCGQEIISCWCGIDDDKDRIIDKEIHLVAYYKSRFTVGKNLILRCKYKFDEVCLDFVATELSKRVFEITKDNTVLCYVPRSRVNLLKTGLDQSYEICKRLSKITGLEFCMCLVNKGNTEQKRLTFKQRERNAVRNFSFDKNKRESVKGKNVILFDDLVTSGATVTRCAILLKRNYAKSVCVLSIGKTAR